MAYFNVDLSDKLRAALDNAARLRLKKTRPMSQFIWLTTTPEGKACFWETSSKPEWKRRSIPEVNDYIRQRYLEATGGLPKGRPQVGQMRAQIIEEALIKFLGLSK